MNGGGDRRPLNSPLIEYALKGLERCWLPEHGRWSHIYHLDGRKDPNEFYRKVTCLGTLNVLLGFSRLPQVPANIDVPRTFEKNALQLLKLPVAKYSFGMALWTAAELNLEVPQEISQHIKSLLNDKKNWWNLRAQHLETLLTGGSLRKQISVRRSFYNTRSRSSCFLKIVTLVILGYFLMRHRDFVEDLRPLRPKRI